jgi:hypothetical protein
MYFVDSTSPYFLIDDDDSYVNVKCFLTSNTVEITKEDLTALEGASVTSINSFLSVLS